MISETGSLQLLNAIERPSLLLGGSAGCIKILGANTAWFAFFGSYEKAPKGFSLSEISDLYRQYFSGLENYFESASDDDSCIFVTSTSKQENYELTYRLVDADEDGTRYYVHSIAIKPSSDVKEDIVNDRYRYAAKATNDVIWDWDITSGTLIWGENFRTLFGYFDEELDTDIRSWTAKIHPEDVQRVKDEIESFMETDESNWSSEYRYQKANGDYAIVIDHGFIIRNNAGKGVRMVGAMHDVTLRRREEQRLRLLESVILNTTDSVVITRADLNEGPLSKIIYVNDAFTLMSGYLPEDVLGKSPRILEGPKTDQAELARVISCLYAGQSCETSMVNYKKNGTEFWNSFSVTPVANENGLPDTWISIQRDVTKEKTDEIRKKLFNDIAEVFNSPGRLHDILTLVLEIINKNTGFSISEIWLPDTYKRNLKLFATRAESEAGCQFYQNTKSIKKIPKGEGLAGKAWEMMDLQLLSDLESSVDFFRRDEALKAGFKTAIGLPLISNGTFIGALALFGIIDQSSASFDILGDELGKFLGAEIKRKQLENELDQIFNFAPDIIAILNFKGYFRKINVAACEFLGYSDNELLSEPVSHFIHPDDREKTMEAVKIATRQDISHFENRYITKSGKVIWMSWTATSVVEESSIFAVGKDITERKNLEDLLFKSNSLAMIGSWEIDREKVYCSELACEIIEAPADFKPDEATISNFFAPTTNGERANESNEVRLEDFENWDEEILIKTLKGNLKWIRTIGQTEIVNGQCIRAYGSIQDINSRKIAEAGIAEATKELEESEKRYHELFHLSPLPMWVYDFETLNFLDVNRAAENSYGYSRDEFLNMTIRDIRPEEELLILERTVRDNAKHDKPFQGTFLHLKKNGNLINAEIKTNLIIFNGRKAKLVVATDITERLLYINTIEQQNEKLKEIAWIQSHVVRAPLARILALTDLFNNSGRCKKLADADIITHVERSAKELDEIIREITVKSDDSKKIN